MYSNLSEEKISKRIDKIIGKLNILRKKKELWGLTEEENISLMNLTVEYAKNYYQLMDNIFDNYIEPFIYNDRIVDIKSQLVQLCGWDGSLLCFDADLQKLFCKLSANKKSKIISLIKELMKEELAATSEFENSDYGKEIIELFSSLQNTNKNNCVTKYIRTRYTIMLSMIEEEE